MRFPELDDATMHASVGDAAIILDAEICAYDPLSRTVLPFQTLQGRAKKAPTAEQVAETSVCVFVFDLLYLEGHSLRGASLGERRALLRQHVRPQPGRLMFAEGEVTSTVSGLEAALAHAVEVGSEGLMCKVLEGDLSRRVARAMAGGWLVDRALAVVARGRACMAERREPVAVAFAFAVL